MSYTKLGLAALAGVAASYGLNKGGRRAKEDYGHFTVIEYHKGRRPTHWSARGYLIRFKERVDWDMDRPLGVTERIEVWRSLPDGRSEKVYSRSAKKGRSARGRRAGDKREPGWEESPVTRGEMTLKELLDPKAEKKRRQKEKRREKKAMGFPARGRKASRKHKLMTAELRRKLPALYANENVKDPIVQAKYFTPYGNAYWLITEYDGDDTMFGWAELGAGMGELGYVSLSELDEVVGGSGLLRGIPMVERDLYFDPQPLSEAKRREQERRGFAARGRRSRPDEATKWVAFFAYPYSPTPEAQRLGAKFAKRIEYLLHHKFKRPDESADVDLVSLSYGSVANEGTGLWEERDSWHTRFEQVVMGDKEARDLGDRLHHALLVGAGHRGFAAHGQRKGSRAKASAPAHGVKVGDVFTSSWGYDQTNVDFYKVVSLRGKTMVEVMKMGQAPVSYSTGSVKVEAAGDVRGPSLRRKVSISAYDGKPSIAISSYEYAYIWSGEPQSQTAPGWGH